MKKSVLVVFIGCIGAFLVAFVISVVMKNSQTNMLQQQERELASLQNQLSQLQLQQAETHTSIIRNTTGIDENRVNTDTEIMKDFMKTVFTWSSYDEYMQTRDTLMRGYHIPADGRFMTVFLPELPNTIDVDGTKYNRIDTNGLKMEYVSLNSHCVGIVGNNYRYVGEVTWRVSDNLGTNGTSTNVVLYTVNADGQISDLDAYVLK